MEDGGLEPGLARKAAIAGLYDRVAPSYGDVGPPVFAWAGRRLVELAEVTPGVRVLDVGTGRGASLLPAAERVGPRGCVVGIDLAAGMVRETAADLRRRHLANIAVLRMDAEALAFRDASFDVVLCGFTILFLDLEPALREFRRVLRPGGRLAVSLAAGSDPRWTWSNDLVVAYGETHDIPLSPPRTGAAWQPPELPAFLQRAGFADVQVHVETEEVVYADAQAWWQAKWTHGARYPLERMPPAVLARFEAEVFDRLAPLKEDNGFHELFRLQCVVGTRLRHLAKALGASS